MPSEREILDLVGLIYDAAGNRALWPTFLERLGQALRTTTNNLFLQNVQAGSVMALATVGMDPAYFHSYLSHYGAKNVHLMRGMRMFRQGQVYRSEELCPDEEAARTEFWNDWLVPQLMHHALFGVVLQENPYAGMINVVRRRNAKPFADEDLVLLGALLPHLERAVQLHQRITRLEMEKRAATDALDRWPLGVILINGRGRVLLMNRSAEAILNQRDGLTLERDGLHAALSNDTIALRRLIRGAVETTNGRGLKLKPGGAIALARPSGKRALNVLITPACSNGHLFPQPGAVVAVFVSDPEAGAEANPEALAGLYGLSPAEVALAGRLLQGKDLAEAADVLCISRNTAKFHLQQIFEKTGARRQAELLRLLLRGPAGLSLGR